MGTVTDDGRMTSEAVTKSESEQDGASLTLETTPGKAAPSGITIILWALVSIAIITYVTLGSVPAYIWRFGRLHEESKSVLGIWTIEANSLPRVSHQWMLNVAFYGALIVFLVGVVAGLWFLLRAADDQTPSAKAASSPDRGTTAV